MLLFIFCSDNGVPDYCGDGQPLNSHTQFCHDGVAYDKCDGLEFNPDIQFCGNRELHTLCNGYEFDPLLEFCAINNVVTERCAGETFNPNTEGCVFGILQKRCGRNFFNQDTEFCHADNRIYDLCNGEEYEPSEGCDGAFPQPKCRGQNYNSDVMFCFDNTTYSKCGGNEYDPELQFCFDDRLLYKCRGETYIPPENPCDDGTNRLYAKLPPILETDTPVDLGGAAGENIVEKTINYVNENPGEYTLLLGSDVVVERNNNIPLTQSGVKLTIMGIDSVRSILNSTFILLEKDIEFTLGNNIALVGLASAGTGVVVQNDATFIMQGNASISGFSNGATVLDATFIMRGSASISDGGLGISNFGTTIMQDNASIFNFSNAGVGGGRTGSVLIMQDNAMLYDNGRNGGGGGAVSVIDTVIMRGNAKIAFNNGGIAVGNINTFIMQDSASIYQNGPDGSYCMERINTLIMQDNAVIRDNRLRMSACITTTDTLIMQDNASIFGNSGGINVAFLTMSDNASVFGNGVAGIEYGVFANTIEMRGNTSIYENGGEAGVITRNLTMHDNTSIYNNFRWIRANLEILCGGTLIMEGGTIYGYDNVDELLYGCDINDGRLLVRTNCQDVTTVQYGDGTNILPHMDGCEYSTNHTIIGRK